MCEADSLKLGDEILITGPTTGVIEMKIEEMQVDRKSVEEVKKGMLFSVPVNEIVRRSDKLYKLEPTIFAQS